MEVTLCLVLNHSNIAQALSYVANGVEFMFFLESIRTFFKKATKFENQKQKSHTSRFSHIPRTKQR